ncbi:hypothetical protein PQX77_020871 [Marasmius sp. AFHP31]|nr:hypothetical protein PQX77_020871 [Marasmius sp. AFHP31]
MAPNSTGKHKVSCDISGAIREEFKTLSKANKLQGTADQRREWRTQNADKSCEECEQADLPCSVPTGKSTSGLRCVRCDKGHLRCSKSRDFRRMLMMEKLKINENQLQALEDGSEEGRNRGAESHNRAQEVGGRTVLAAEEAGAGSDGEEDLEPETVMVKTETDAHDAMTVDSTSTKSRVATSLEARASSSQGGEATNSFVADELEYPSLADELRHLKREIEEVTTSLRFNRETRQGSIKRYEQAALRLGDIMYTFGQEE